MIDNKATQRIEEFIKNPKPTDEEIQAMAMVMLQLEPGRRSFVASINVQPQKYVAHLKHELNKHMKYRLKGLTLNDVHILANRILPAVDDVLKNDKLEGIEDVEDEKVNKRHGRREDHDDLPESVAKLWDENAERWKKMKELRATCESLQHDCDRYEYLDMLDDMYKHYKDSMKKYDDYVAGSEVPTNPAAEAKDITNARSYISNNRKKYDELVESGDNDKAQELHEKIQQRVDLLINAKAEFGGEYIEWLKDNKFIEA